MLSWISTSQHLHSNGLDIVFAETEMEAGFKIDYIRVWKM